jgi:serine/threonine protein kinase
MLADDYTVVAFLRRGHDLDVYDLWSESRGCRCVGKTLRPDRLTSRDARSRLLKEGRLLLGLTHPHIVRAYEVLRAPAPAVILETLPGETLSHLIERKPRGLEGEDVALLGVQLASAIGYLHHRGVLHLDLKPSNIVVSHGLARVLDLSVARKPGCHKGGIGTIGYMAPEQAMGGELGTAADVWGIGAALYEAATGDPACDIADDISSAAARASVCRPAPVRRSRRIPATLAAVIDRCLSFAAAERPDPAELRTALEAIAAGWERSAIGYQLSVVLAVLPSPQLTTHDSRLTTRLLPPCRLAALPPCRLAALPPHHSPSAAAMASNRDRSVACSVSRAALRAASSCTALIRGAMNSS